MVPVWASYLGIENPTMPSFRNCHNYDSSQSSFEPYLSIQTDPLPVPPSPGTPPEPHTPGPSLLKPAEFLSETALVFGRRPEPRARCHWIAHKIKSLVRLFHLLIWTYAVERRLYYFRAFKYPIAADKGLGYKVSIPHRSNFAIMRIQFVQRIDVEVFGMTIYNNLSEKVIT